MQYYHNICSVLVGIDFSKYSSVHVHRSKIARIDSLYMLTVKKLVISRGGTTCVGVGGVYLLLGFFKVRVEMRVLGFGTPFIFFKSTW